MRIYCIRDDISHYLVILTTNMLCDFFWPRCFLSTENCFANIEKQRVHDDVHTSNEFFITSHVITLL